MPAAQSGSTGRAGRFDGQAADFDCRAGLPADAVVRIARALDALASTGSVLELGAGTGEIGIRLARGPQPPGRPRRTYLGLDLSTAMLALFAQRRSAYGAEQADERPSIVLARADADRAWPVRDATVGLIFASRSAHLLDPGHLADEARRVAAPGGLVVAFGRVRRPEESVRSRLRRQLHQLLKQEGHAVRGGGKARERLARSLVDRGARPGAETPVPVATWPTVETPEQALADWRSKPGLAGQPLPAVEQARLLDRLEDWARERFGDLRASVPSTESYLLDAFVFGEPELALPSPFTASPSTPSTSNGASSKDELPRPPHPRMETA